MRFAPIIISMKKYQTEYWKITLPDEWQVDDNDEGLTLFHPDGAGELQISTVKFDEEPGGEALLELAAEHIEAGAEPEEVTLGEFDGIVLEYEVDDEYGCEWYLLAGSLFLFATYICNAGDDEQEHDVIAFILESLILISLG